MAQTTVNQYFAARKSSSTIHPSKKRKVDASDIEVDLVSKKKTISRVVNRAKSRRKSKKGSLNVPAAPHVQEKLFPLSQAPKTPEKTLEALNKVLSGSPVGKVKVNEAINDQAKIILHSRGSAILQASLQGRIATSPAKASEVLNTMSPHKAKQQTSEISIVKDEITNLQSRKDQLRKKYSNLLKDEESMESANTKQSSTKGSRLQLRDKYKHLLSKEPALGSDSSMDKAKAKGFSPSKSPSKVSSPQKAFEKYRHLTEKNVTSTFQLPQKYKLLLEMFRCTDSVLFLLHQRSEVCTFDRLKKSVQSMCGRNFGLDNLAAMKTVYPSGFVFRQEKGLYGSNGNGKTSDYQLTVEANYNDLQIARSSIKNNSSVLITRRLKFENKLVEMTRGHHQKFLRKLNLKIDDNEIHRWHPHFKVDDVPNIEQSNLPKPPVNKCFSTATDLLLNNQHFSSKVTTALQNAKYLEHNIEGKPTQSTTTTSTITSKKETSSSTISKPQNTRLKGVSSDILERIRQKEKKKIELQMTRNPKQELRLSRMERLPDMSRIIKSYFVAERKVAIALDDCVQKLSESYGTDLHTSNIEEHVRLIAEIVPKWLQIVPVRKCMYVKLAKNFDINNVINTLTDVKKKEETSRW